nr:GPO family capsid scaffolding protein [Halomonas elongata]
MEAKEVEDGKLALFADIDPTDRLKEMNKQRQKVYSSIEVNPSFSDTGEAYLEGLAVTGLPGQSGHRDAQVLTLRWRQVAAGRSQTTPRQPLHRGCRDRIGLHRKPAEAEGPNLLERVTALFKKHDAKTAKGFEAFSKELEQTLELFVEKHKALADDLASRPDASAFNKLKRAHEATKQRLDELYAQLDNTPIPRPAPRPGR